MTITIPNWQAKTQRALQMALARINGVDRSAISFQIVDNTRRKLQPSECISVEVTIKINDIERLSEIKSMVDDTATFTSALADKMTLEGVPTTAQSLSVGKVQYFVDAPGVTGFPTKQPTRFPTPNPTSLPTQFPTVLLTTPSFSSDVPSSEPQGDSITDQPSESGLALEVVIGIVVAIIAAGLTIVVGLYCAYKKKPPLTPHNNVPNKFTNGAPVRISSLDSVLKPQYAAPPIRPQYARRYSTAVRY
jgi:hypothetical protein